MGHSGSSGSSCGRSRVVKGPMGRNYEGSSGFQVQDVDVGYFGVWVGVELGRLGRPFWLYSGERGICVPLLVGVVIFLVWLLFPFVFPVH
eukprot:snap_masked-scaffold_84-processed-gene-0.19-mRNA-1 protein AED:1.00 eAED:1.00 QI:0/0/0/0/1/1/2/0/89